MSQKFKKKSAAKAKPAVTKEKQEEEVVETLKSRREKKEGAKRVAITIFAVFIAILMMVPSIGQIIMGRQAENAAKEGIHSVEDVDKMFKEQLDSVVKAAQDNPDDKNAQLAVPQFYMQWASYANILSQTDEDKQHTADLYEKASEAYDKVLADHSDWSAAHVGKASCMYAQGNEEDAISYLEKYNKENPDDPQILFGLGNLKNSKDERDEAKALYQRVVEVAGEDNKELAEAAQNRIDSINEKDAKDAQAAQEDKESTNKDSESAEK